MSHYVRRLECPVPSRTALEAAEAELARNPPPPLTCSDTESAQVPPEPGDENKQAA